MAGEATHRQKDTGKLTLKLSTNSNSDLPVYVAGNFNDWKASDDRYQLEKTDEYNYQLIFPDKSMLPDILEYKYLRGDWNCVELDAYGKSANNRKLLLEESVVVEDKVPLWMNDGKYYDDRYLPIANIISEHFEIPQLIKTRRITALLPYDYYDTDKRYPVLYLQDGQNLFDDYAPFGNWAVDKKMALMAEKGLDGIIVVAIDHAKEERLEEFTPSYQTKLGVGDGKKYVRFLADTLKPYIDKHFRTKSEREYTGIGGSSMGALISIYAGLIYPEVYSKLLIFSPSLWVTPNMHFHYMNLYHAQKMKVYLYGGEGESATMVPNLQRLKEALEKKTSSEVEFELSIDPHGQHNEARWGVEFPKAVEWLFFNTQD
jgi:predicted alpha/beta superfamily hydrolase